MRFFLLGLVSSLCLACAPEVLVAYPGTLPPGARLNMNGTFTLSPRGELLLTLASPCRFPSTEGGRTASCTSGQLDRIPVVAHAPWNVDVPGVWVSPGTIAFHVDWKTANLDATAANAQALAARPWSITGVHWNPNAAETKKILRLVSNGPDFQPEVITEGEPAVQLEVAPIEIDGNLLHAGRTSLINVKITNSGSVAAYAVTATARWSLDTLSDEELAFGAIDPGGEKVRQLKVTLPASETAPDAMLLLVFSEASGAAPANVSRRITIVPASAAPVLGLQCQLDGADVKAKRPEIDAGQKLPLTCIVSNTGHADARQVTVEVAIGGQVGRAAAQPIPIGKKISVDWQFTVARDLPIDAPVEIVVTARDTATTASAAMKITGVIRKPRLCQPGQLTRAQYRAKIAELRSALTSGDVSQAQFDGYDAELLACLK